VRSVQVHDQPVDRAEAGQRVALAVPGVGRTALRRGDALLEAGAYPLSYRLDVELEELEPIPDHARLQVHHGTTETPARLVRVGDRFAQLRLAEPVVAARGDRFVLRDRTTLGGGRILDPAPPRTPDVERLELLATDDPVSIVTALVHEPVRGSELAARALLGPDELERGLASVEHSGEWYFARDWVEKVRREAATRLKLRAEAAPLDPGLSVGELLASAPWADDVLPLLDLEQRDGKVYLPGSAPGLGERAEDAARLEVKLTEAGLAPVAVEDAELARFLEASGRLVRLGGGLAIGAGAYDQAKRALVGECERSGKITLARFRDLLGISRKPAQLILERFDADGLTRRIGDERVLRRGATIDT
jgi:selenocysteine-specific elongation factor